MPKVPNFPVVTFLTKLETQQGVRARQIKNIKKWP